MFRIGSIGSYSRCGTGRIQAFTPIRTCIGNSWCYNSDISICYFKSTRLYQTANIAQKYGGHSGHSK